MKTGEERERERERVEVKVLAFFMLPVVKLFIDLRCLLFHIEGLRDLGVRTKGGEESFTAFKEIGASIIKQFSHYLEFFKIQLNKKMTTMIILPLEVRVDVLVI